LVLHFHIYHIHPISTFRISYFCGMEINCSAHELFVFKKIAHAAAALQMPSYIIGGFVRDKLIGRRTKDADIVCVGSGIELAHKVALQFSPVPPVAFFKTFGTAQIKLDDFEIEFVAVRNEEEITFTIHHLHFQSTIIMLRLFFSLC